MSGLRESRIPKRPCPHCGYELDAATDPDGQASPKPGDAGVCADCGGFMVFSLDLSLRKPSQAEYSELMRDPMALHLQQVARKHSDG